MKKRALLLAVLMVAATRIGLAQAAKPATAPKTISQVLEGSVTNTEGDFVSAAQAMPEEKYDFAPSRGEFKGVRTFARQVKHVAAVNYMTASAILGEKPPVELGSENGPESMTTKADIVKFLKDSFAYAHRALASINEKNEVEPIKDPFGGEEETRLGMAMVFSWHAMDHYGQMVEYLRMNGIIPPASRPQQ